MKKLMFYAKKYKQFPILMGMVCAILAIIIVIQNITIAKILDVMLMKTHHDIPIFNMLIILLIVLLLRATLNMFNQLLGTQLAFKVKYHLRKQMINKRYHTPVGEQMSVMTESIDGMTPFYQDYLPQVFKAMMTPIAIIVTMFFIHINTALIMLVTAPFIPVFYILFGLKTRDESKAQMTYLTQFSQRFLNLAQGLVTLKLFNQSKKAETTIYDESTKFRDLTMKILRSAFLSGLMLEFISLLGIGLVALEAGLGLVLFHNLTFETAAIAIILAPEFYNSIKDLGQAFHTGKQSEGAADVVFETLDAKDTNKTSNKDKVDTAQHAQIRLVDVYYHYPESERDVIRHANLEINAGDHIALVGPSGAGKTTLSQLILKLRQPTKGHVYFQSDDISLGMLSQQPYIFNATIKENVTMFKDVSDDVVHQVLDAVGLTEKIKLLPKGIYTLIGEGGEMLSGGQMRRVELSRVLLARPEIVVFDEPTTGLDVYTERIIHQALHTYFSQHTVIMIAHRQSTIQAANRRIYMEHGQIISDDQTISIQKQDKGREER